MKLKDFLAENLPEISKDLLPSHAKLFGGVALLRLRPELEGYKHRIGELARMFYDVEAVYLV
ncbi:MAG TPA: class I SAM-dependent methyltransferase family protein, partial [Nitrososphaeria archaeon]|nr:class I SAM-dependent methyltransferase family protein [Nitrososphaeria archaeon]